MSEEVQAGAGTAKIRNLWIVALLLIVTIGIYYLVWYFMIKRELRDFGRGRDETLASISPWMGVLAMTLGWYIIVPPFVSAWRTVRHVQLAERVGGIEDQHAINHPLGFVFFIVGFVLLPIEVFYLQAHLNRLWRHARDEHAKAEAGMRGVAAAT